MHVYTLPMRKKLIAANWKMNQAPAGWQEKNSPYRPHSIIDIVVFPSFLDIWNCLQRGILIGGQCGRAEPGGAFTGDVSMKMLKEIGCTYVLCGHSERRQYHHETDEDIAKQATAAFEAGLIPVICIGENLTEREAGDEKDVVTQQMQTLSLDGEFIIAYEPVWAIGTGKNATAAQAQEMHALIRSLLPSHLQSTTRILYGGSVKADNCKEILEQADVDGGLVGGASLQSEAFRAIVETAVN